MEKNALREVDEAGMGAMGIVIGMVAGATILLGLKVWIGIFIWIMALLLTYMLVVALIWRGKNGAEEAQGVRR